MSEKREPPRPAKPPHQAQRDKRLAAALRANLRRRKAAAKAAPQGKQPPK